MSNELTIATITATIQDILQSTVDAKLPGTIVTRGNPVVSDEGIPKKRLNVKMYQSNANTSLRDADPRPGAQEVSRNQQKYHKTFIILLALMVMTRNLSRTFFWVVRFRHLAAKQALLPK